MRHFFFYGTLVAGSDNPMVRGVYRKLDHGRPAVARGTLHAVPDAAGWYPALLPGEGEVHGKVYATGPEFSAADLAALDAYENFEPGDPAVSEYLRREIVVNCAGEALRAEAYLYNAPLPATACAIAGGDFRAFLAREGLPEYCASQTEYTTGKDDQS